MSEYTLCFVFNWIFLRLALFEPQQSEEKFVSHKHTHKHVLFIYTPPHKIVYFFFGLRCRSIKLGQLYNLSQEYHSLDILTFSHSLVECPC